MSKKFGDLVKSKLIELNLTQSHLGMRIRKSKSYMTYVVTGINPTAQSRKFQPGPDVVAMIARELGIPLEVAFEAAGHDPLYAMRYALPDPPEREPVKNLGEETGTGESNFDIAYRAALAAIRTTSGEPESADAASVRSKTVKIDLTRKMHLLLINEGDPLTPDEIDRYRAAFIAAYEAAR